MKHTSAVDTHISYRRANPSADAGEQMDESPVRPPTEHVMQFETSVDLNRSANSNVDDSQQSIAQSEVLFFYGGPNYTDPKTPDVLDIANAQNALEAQNADNAPQPNAELLISADEH